MMTINIEMPKKIESERLILRPYEKSDAEMYFNASIRNRQHLEKFESENVIMEIETLEDSERLIGELEEEWEKGTHFFMGIFLKNSGEFVGQFYIRNINPNLPEFSLGYFCDVNHQNNGYITEATNACIKMLFTEMHAHKIQIHCNDTNIRSIKIGQRCGFKQEGHLRECIKMKDGSITGRIFFGLLHREFKEKK